MRHTLRVQTSLFPWPATSIENSSKCSSWARGRSRGIVPAQVSVLGLHRNRLPVLEFREVSCIGAKSKLWGNFGISGDQLVAVVILAPIDGVVRIQIQYRQVGV